MERDSAKRKQAPLFSGLLRYAPDALEAIARKSWKGNEKHNPGLPLHHCRAKSADHGDCLVRHQVEYDQPDDDGEFHAVAVAWRAIMQLQELLERHGAPRAPGSFSAQCPACMVVPQPTPIAGPNAYTAPELRRMGMHYCERCPALLPEPGVCASCMSSDRVVDRATNRRPPG